MNPAERTGTESGNGNIFPRVESQRPTGFRSRLSSLAGRVGEVYLQVFRVYRAWWMYILPFAFVIVIPIDLLDAVVTSKIEEIGSGQTGKYAVLATIAGALSWSSLLGQVFMAGAIGLSLVHEKDRRPPSLAWMARHIRYWRLIAVDLLYVLAIVVGTVLLIIPGIIAFVVFSLAGPVVEIEEHRVRAAFARSFRLVRKDFWLVFCVLATVQLAGIVVGQGLEYLARALFGEETIIDHLAEGASSVLLEPLFAVAAVLLVLRLIGRVPPQVASPRSS